jgi:hypothetical protein
MSTKTPPEVRLALKYFVENFYDFQERRLATGGRTRSQTIQLFEIDKIRLERATSTLLEAEKDALNDVKDALKRIPFYVETLSDKKRYKGLGPTMAGVILSQNDITRQDFRSKMWAFSGLRPIACLRCAKCHQVVELQADGSLDHPTFRPRNQEDQKPKRPEKCESRKYYESGKAQRPESGKKLTYNKWLRTKLVGVLGPCLLKCKSPWAEFYYNYKHRKTQEHWGISDGHRHNASVRYMVKMLLGDIWEGWRRAEGLSVREPYEAEYLNKSHHETTPLSTRSVASDETGLIEMAQIDEELRLAEES